MARCVRRGAVPGARRAGAPRTARGRRARHRRADLGDALLAAVRRVGDGRHRRAGRSRPSARARARRCCSPPTRSSCVDTGDPMPEGFDAVVMREHVHYDDAARAELRAAVAPYQHVRSIGEDISATELLLPAGHRLRRGRRRRRGGRRRHRRARAPGAGRRDAADRRRDAPDRHRSGARRDARHQLAHARRAGRGDRVRAAWRGRSCPTSPTRSRPPSATPPRVRPRDRRRGVQRRARRLHRRARRASSARWPSTAWPSGPGTRSCSAPSTPRRCSALPAIRCRRR